MANEGLGWDPPKFIMSSWWGRLLPGHGGDNPPTFFFVKIPRPFVVYQDAQDLIQRSLGRKGGGHFAEDACFPLRIRG